MDEVVEKFHSTLGSIIDKDGQKQNFEGLYKNWGRLGHQEDRRKQLLEFQKSDRNKNIDNFRGIMEIVDAVENRNVRVCYRPSIYVAGFNKVSQSYRNVLMLSEWLIEKPEDFHENWFVVPCPKGTRMLVVANRGSTKCYSKYGQFMKECHTALPGGNPFNKKQSVQCCVLDCFWQEKNNTMYVLDLLAWNSQTMTDGEMEFRHFWLTSQLDDFASLRIISKYNDIIFSVLPKIPCDFNNFNEFMSKYPAFEGNFPQLDGLLFYHKEARYVGGETPLVGWLFPYMVQEVLGSDITVHKNYLFARPAGYTSQANFIAKFEEKNAKKHRNRRLPNNGTASNDTSHTKSGSKAKKSNVKSLNAEELKAVEEMDDGTENKEVNRHRKEHDSENKVISEIEKMDDGTENKEVNQHRLEYDSENKVSSVIEQMDEGNCQVKY